PRTTGCQRRCSSSTTSKKKKETANQGRGVGSVAAWPSAVEPNFPDPFNLQESAATHKSQTREKKRGRSALRRNLPPVPVLRLLRAELHDFLRHVHRGALGGHLRGEPGDVVVRVHARDRLGSVDFGLGLRPVALHLLAADLDLFGTRLGLGAVRGL